jgi:LCP family protein required for cell wall assembly
VVLLASTAWAVYRYQRVATKMAPTKEIAVQLQKELDPAPAVASKEPMYVLLMGDDKRPGEKRARSDTLMLARVDAEQKKIFLLSIPRDTRVPIEGHGTTKINAAYAYGGPALAVKTVKAFTGLPVNHFMEIDFQGLTRVVDSMGGLWINVDRPIRDEYRKRNGDGVVSIDKGFQKLNGAQALTYVRSRWFPAGDFVRVLHQREFVMAVAKQALTPAQIPRLPWIIDTVSENLTTDMSVQDLLALAQDMKGISKEQFVGRTVPGKGAMINGGWYLIPDKTRTADLLNAMKNGTAPAGKEDSSFQ